MAAQKCRSQAPDVPPLDEAQWTGAVLIRAAAYIVKAGTAAGAVIIKAISC